MNIPEIIHQFRRRRKVLREKSHFWDIAPAQAGYIQNYKVATRSIRLAIARYLLAQRGEVREYDEIPLEQVRALDDQVGSFLTPTKIRKRYPDHFIFTFVRDPLARLYSCYSNKLIDSHQKGLRNRFERYGITPECSFDDFVRIIADVPDREADRHFRSQHCFVNDAQGIPVTDFTGKLEYLHRDWQHLADRFGFPELPHQNKSPKSTVPPRERYSRESLLIAQERFRQDLEQFGYADEL